MSDMRYHGGRALLNRVGHESTAAIVAEIRNTRYDAPNTELWVPAPAYTLQLSDCTRSVTFDLSFHDAEARENNLFKVSKMIDVLKTFQSGLELETVRYSTRLQEAERRRKESGTLDE